jgi:hypothetical protein
VPPLQLPKLPSLLKLPPQLQPLLLRRIRRTLQALAGRLPEVTTPKDKPDRNPFQDLLRRKAPWATLEMLLRRLDLKI